MVRKISKKEIEESAKMAEPKTDLEIITDAMLEKKAKGVCALDLRGIGTGICDHFVICNADSGTNVIAIADNIEEQMLVKAGRKLVRQQGRENAVWIILDYTDIVIHIFQTEYREFYRLEELWADAPIQKFEDD